MTLSEHEKKEKILFSHSISKWQGKIILSDPAVPEAARLLQIVKRLNTPYLHELSFKLMASAVLCNRFLLSLHKKFIRPNPQTVLTNICVQLNMPAIFQEEILENNLYGDVIHLGFEEGLHNKTYKLYLEYAESIHRAVMNQRSDPLLAHLAFKWDPNNPTKHTIARYMSFPSLTVKEMIHNLLSIYDFKEDSIPYLCAKRLLTLAAKKMPEKDILYLEVTEENNPRHSYDINIYDAEISLKEILPLLSPVLRYFNIPEKESRYILETERDKIIGHISGGTGRDGKEFCSIHYGVEWY